MGPNAAHDMTKSGKLGYLEAAGIWILRTLHARDVAAIILAISAPLVCIFLARTSERWDLLERSGSITTAIGLLLASRRYIHYGALELATAREQNSQPKVTEAFEDVLTAKSSLALSACGTIVWGWGSYLRWWSFTGLFVWALLAIRDVRRDLNKAAQLGLGPGP
jgi:hypothetical protein